MATVYLIHFNQAYKHARRIGRRSTGAAMRGRSKSDAGASASVECPKAKALASDKSAHQSHIIPSYERIQMRNKNSTTQRSKSKQANTGVAPSDSTMIRLKSDYPGLGFKRGTEIGLQPVNVKALDPAWLVAVRVGNDVLIGHPYTIDETQFGLASPTIFNFSDVEVLGELAAA